LSLYLFYALPIAYAAWATSRRGTIAVAVLAGFAWAAANYQGHRYESDAAYAWVAFNRAIYFVLVAAGALAFRGSQRHLQARVSAMARAGELEREMARALEAQQSQLGRELHDGICQNLAAISWALECLQTDVAEGHTDAEAVGNIHKMVVKTMSEVRALARAAFPLHLQELGLCAPLSDLAAMVERSYGISIETNLPTTIELPSLEIGMHVYRLVQEALSNAARHSGASQIHLTLERSADAICFEVMDNGMGFSPSETPSGMGLQTMKSRADLIGAKLQFSRNPTGGTRVSGILPIAPVVRSDELSGAATRPVPATS
jgi:signal transduction histidine kinase